VRAVLYGVELNVDRRTEERRARKEKSPRLRTNARSVPGDGDEEGNTGWRWYVSVAPEADAVWWRRNGVDRLWVLDGDARFDLRTGESLPPRNASLGKSLERLAKLQAERTVGSVGRGQWFQLRPMRGGWEPDHLLYERIMERLTGRLLLREELDSMLADAEFGLCDPSEWLPYVQWGALAGRLRLRCGLECAKPSGFWGRRIGARLGERWIAGRWFGGAGSYRWRDYRCIRCGGGGSLLRPTDCPICGETCPYCEACLGMGRVRFCSLVVQGVEMPRMAIRSGDSHNGMREDDTAASLVSKWRLSEPQAEATREALKYLERGMGGTFLFWAVTGAGKTEMMFPLVDRTLRAGGRAVVATPRKDVVLELEPRFRNAFPEARVVALYGGSRDRWNVGDITLATTHQLFRFREAFDLVVLDEVDAFPFHGDPMLAYAAEGACVSNGMFVLLSATPPAALRRAARRGMLPHAKVCVRFHRRPLPVPRRMSVPPMRRWAERGLPAKLRNALAASLERGAQIFVFVPRIDLVTGVVRQLTDAFPDVSVGGTSSKDEMRAEKVVSFRERELRVIVTTTILERGVTVPKTDVFILDADSALFDGAALVQMAGRAGRKAEDPQGNVYFFSAEWTKSQREAIRDIQEMNGLARRKGYLVE